MPHYIPHAVFNLDETVAVGDNPFYSSAIEEAAFELSRKNNTVFSVFNGTTVLVSKGMRMKRLSHVGLLYLSNALLVFIISIRSNEFIFWTTNN